MQMTVAAYICCDLERPVACMQMTWYTINVVFCDSTTHNVMTSTGLLINDYTKVRDVIAFLKLPQNTVMADEHDLPLLPDCTLAEQRVSAGIDQRRELTVDGAREILRLRV